jgi:hypothetical protein
MSPPAADIDLAVKPTDYTEVDGPISVKSLKSSLPPADAAKPETVRAEVANRLDGPLKYSGSLDAFDSHEVTPVIGREYPDLNLVDLLEDDDKLRDLAVLGV